MGTRIALDRLIFSDWLGWVVVVVVVVVVGVKD
jgi:hypothetical protein